MSFHNIDKLDKMGKENWIGIQCFHPLKYNKVRAKYQWKLGYIEVNMPTGEAASLKKQLMSLCYYLLGGFGKIDKLKETNQ